MLLNTSDAKRGSSYMGKGTLMVICSKYKLPNLLGFLNNVSIKQTSQLVINAIQTSLDWNV